MNNVTELRSELIKVFTGVKAKKMETGIAKTLVAASNSIIKTVKSELEYNKHLGVKKKIKFLETK